MGRIRRCFSVFLAISPSAQALPGSVFAQVPIESRSSASVPFLKTPPLSAQADQGIVLTASEGLVEAPSLSAPMDAPGFAAAAAAAVPDPAPILAAGDGSRVRADRIDRGSHYVGPVPHGAVEEKAESGDMFDGVGIKGFSIEESADLRSAMEHGHQIAVLARDDGRRIVLMSESHNKSVQGAEAALRFKNHFPHRGLERADLSLLVGGRLVAGIVLPISRAVSFVRSFGRDRHRSAVADSEVEEIVDSLAPMQVGAIQRRIDAMPDRRLDQLIPEIGISYRRFAQILKESAARTGSPRLSFNLEEGHVPDLAEQVLSVALPVLFVDFILLAARLQLPQYPLVAALKCLSAAIGGCLTADVLIGERLQPYLRERRWFRVAFPFGRYPYVEAFIRGRNETVALNSNRAMEEYPEIDRLLVIAGALHFPGLRALLESRYGFHEESPPDDGGKSRGAI